MDLGLGFRQAFARYTAAFMRLYRAETDYTESQCEACTYDHRCCDLTVYVTPFEAEAILSHLNATRPLEVPRWKKRIREAARRLRFHASRYADESEAIVAWYAKKQKCVFYSGLERRCLIYDARPMNCRKLYSVDNCDLMKWRTALENQPVLRQRIDLMPHWDNYDQNYREMNAMLESMMGDKQTRIGLKLQHMILDKGQMDDLDYVNPEEKAAHLAQSENKRLTSA